MQIEEIKKLIKNSTSVLVLDNGEPSFVILDYKAYRNLASGKTDEKEVKISQPVTENNGLAGGQYYERESEILDRLNKEILALKNQIEAEEKGLPNQQG